MVRSCGLLLLCAAAVAAAVPETTLRAAATPAAEPAAAPAAQQQTTTGVAAAATAPTPSSSPRPSSIRELEGSSIAVDETTADIKRRTPGAVSVGVVDGLASSSRTMAMEAVEPGGSDDETLSSLITEELHNLVTSDPLRQTRLLPGADLLVDSNSVKEGGMDLTGVKLMQQATKIEGRGKKKVKKMDWAFTALLTVADIIFGMKIVLSKIALVFLVFKAVILGNIAWAVALAIGLWTLISQRQHDKLHGHGVHGVHEVHGVPPSAGWGSDGDPHRLADRAAHR